MYFLDCKLKRQREILLTITPHIKALLAVVKWVEQKRTGGEKAKAAKAARLAASIAMENAVGGSDEAKEESKKLQLEASEALEEAEQEAAQNGVDLISEIIDVALVEQYDGVLKILAGLYGTTPEALEEEKGIFEIVDMIQETLSSEVLVRFFPQLKRLAREPQSAT